MSDVDQFKKALGGLAIDTDPTPTVAEGGPVDQLTDSIIQERLAADAAAGTAIALTKLYVNAFNFPVRVVRATVSPDVDVAANATTFGTLILSTDDGANGAPVQAGAVDSSTTGGGAWSADVAKDLVLSHASTLLAPGACLFYSQTKASTGVQFPARMLSVRLRRA